MIENARAIYSNLSPFQEIRWLIGATIVLSSLMLFVHLDNITYKSNIADALGNSGFPSSNDRFSNFSVISDGNTGSGNTGSGNTGSGNTGSGTGSGAGSSSSFIPPITPETCGRYVVNLDGVDNYLTATHGISQSSGTWEAWVYAEDWSPSSGEQVLFSNGVAAADDNSFYLSLNAESGLQFRNGGESQFGTATISSIAALSFSDGSWHHLAASWEENTGILTMKLIVDGVESVSGTSSAIFSIGSTLHFGGSPNQESFGAGKIAEVRMWNTSRLSTEVSADKGSFLDGVEDGLSDYWSLYEEQGANSLENSVAGGQSLTLENMDSNTDLVYILNPGFVCSPVITDISGKLMYEHAELTFTVEATDPLPISTGLTFSLDATSLSKGMAINASNGTFAWTSGEEDQGDHSVTVTADDGTLSSQKTFSITVLELNAAPILVQPDNVFASADVEVAIDIIATDEDVPNQTLAYSIDESSLGNGMSINESTGNFSWTPDSDDLEKDFEVTVSVVEEADTTWVQSVISVSTQYASPYNAAQILGKPNVYPNYGDLPGTWASNTPDGNVEFIEIAYSPILAAKILIYETFNPGSIEQVQVRNVITGDWATVYTGTASGYQESNILEVDVSSISYQIDAVRLDLNSPAVPGFNEIDAVGIERKVNDPVSKKFAVILNSAPVMQSIEDQMVDEGSQLSFSAIATDNHNPAQTLSYDLDATSKSKEMSIDDAGLFTWTPGETMDGDHNVTITVSDGNLTDEQVFTITVNEVNQLPVISDIDDVTGNAGTEISISVTATDTDIPSQPLSYILDQASIDKGMVIGETTGIFSWTPGNTSAGSSNDVSVTVSDGVGSVQTSFQIYVNVNKSNQTITFAAITDKIYGDDSFSLNANASSGLPVVFTITEGPAGVSGTRIEIRGAGDVTIMASQSGNGSYNAASTTRKFTVAKAPLKVTANALTRSYGAANPEFTVSYEGFVNGDDEDDITPPVASTQADETSPVTEEGYPISLTGGSANDYELTRISGILTVEKADLIATVNNVSREFGEDNPAFTVSYAGFANGDTDMDITAPVASTSATNTSPNGQYEISLSGGSAQNYALTLKPGTLTIGKAQLIVRADDLTRSYGSANPPLTLSYDGFVNGDTPEDITPPVASAVVESGTVPGVYAITLIGGSADNYELVLEAGELTVNKAPLTVTTEKVIDYGQPIGDFEIVYSGFVNGQNATILETLPTASTTAVDGSNAGSYPITVAGGTSELYDFIYDEGTLTIRKLMATITISELEQEISDEGNQLVVTTDPADLAYIVTYDGSTQPPTEPGEYEVVVEIDDLNYEGAAAGTLIINSAVTAIEELPVVVSIYPNPVQDILSVEVTNSSLNQVEVYNLNGVLMMGRSLVGNKAEIDVQAWPTGMYLIRLMGNNNETLMQRKFIKE